MFLIVDNLSLSQTSLYCITVSSWAQNSNKRWSYDVDREEIGNGVPAVKTQKSACSQEQNPARCWMKILGIFTSCEARECLAAFRMKTNDWQLLRVVKVGIAFNFMCLTCSPSVLKWWSSGFFKANHKGNRKEKTNKPKLGKKIPEQQEQVPVNAVYLISAKRKRHCKSVFFFPS